MHTGMHAAADLLGVDDHRVFQEAAAHRVEVMPLSAYYAGAGPRDNGLILGFGACSATANVRAMEHLARAIEAAGRTADALATQSGDE